MKGVPCNPHHTRDPPATHRLPTPPLCLIGWFQPQLDLRTPLAILGAYAGWAAFLGALAEARTLWERRQEQDPRRAHPYIYMPPPRVPEFVGRQRDLKYLTHTLKPGTKLAFTGLVGMGGLGKTELAKEGRRPRRMALWYANR